LVSQIMPPGAVYHPADITAYEVKYPGYSSYSVPGYLARPSALGQYPGLIFVHGVHGYEEHMKDVARRFAVLGYSCIVPALYCRDEFRSVVEEDDLPKASKWLGSRPNAQTIGDLAGALSFLQTSPQTSPYVSERIGLVGFCSGGRLALIFACNSKGLGAFVNFYSNGIYQSTDVNPAPAAEMVENLSCPMLGLFGDDDANPSPDDVARLRKDLEASSKTFELVSYKDAAHAFFSDTRPSYRPEASQMAWGRCLEWLSRYLKP